MRLFSKNNNILFQLLLGTVFFATTLFSTPLFSSYENSTAVGQEKDKQVFFHSLSYSVSSDAADANDQKVFNQGLWYTGTYYFLDRYYANGSVGASFQSVDQSLVENDNGTFNISDVALSLGTTGFSIYKSNTNRLMFFSNLRNVFPLSERSRNEGYKSVTSFSSDLVFTRKFLGLFLNARYAHVFNTFDMNLAGNPNTENVVSGGLGFRLSFSRFRFQYGYRLGVRQFMDGTNLGSSGNNFSLMGILPKNFWVSANLSNVSYAEEQFVDLWFFDPFVRIYSLSAGVTF